METHQYYLRAVDEARARLHDLETNLQGLADSPRYVETIGRLRCFRGIDSLSALILTVELGDPRRFGSAPALTRPSALADAGASGNWTS